MTRLVLALAAAVATLIAPSASALRVKLMTTRDLVAESALVVVGKVTDSRSSWRAEGAASTPGAPRADIITDATVEVGEALVGRAPGPNITVRQLGGIVDGSELHVAGVRYLRPGEEVLLFLRTDGQRFYLVGFAQGSLFLERSPSGVELRRDTSALELVTARRGPSGAVRAETPPPREPFEPLRALVLSLAAGQLP